MNHQIERHGGNPCLTQDRLGAGDHCLIGRRMCCQQLCRQCPFRKRQDNIGERPTDIHGKPGSRLVCLGHHAEPYFASSCVAVRHRCSICVIVSKPMRSSISLKGLARSGCQPPCLRRQIASTPHVQPSCPGSPPRSSVGSATAAGNVSAACSAEISLLPAIGTPCHPAVDVGAAAHRPAFINVPVDYQQSN